jgi:hypothetical protein
MNEKVESRKNVLKLLTDWITAKFSAKGGRK